MYDETHSITFATEVSVDKDGRLIGQNTWTSWHLIPANRPSVAPPAFSPKMVEIPGRDDGPIDISEYLTGAPNFGSRTGSWDFYVDNDHEKWNSIYQNMLYALHGKQLYCMLDDDRPFYYKGRFTVGQYNADKSNSRIQISYTLEPYKHFAGEAGDFLWDPFNFLTDRTDQFNNDKRL